MATNATLVQSLIAGIVDATGTAAASCLARFYEPGTTTPISVYSDAAASSTITQPLTLDAAGRGEAYTLVACRIIVKDAADSTTIFDSDYASNIRDRQVLITHPNVNGGSETTLYDLLSSVTDPSVAMYLEGSAATSRSVHGWLRESAIKITDYAATGNGSADDQPEIQAAIDRAAAADRTNSAKAKTVVVEVPEGTWDMAAALTMTVASGNTPITLRGQGSKKSILSLTSTTANGITLNWSVGSTDARVIIEDLKILAESNSSGTGISITTANNCLLRNVEVAGFRTGFDTSGATGCILENCTVSSTDGNAAAVGINPGNDTVIENCVLTGTSTNGTAIAGSGTGIQVINPRISGWANGIAPSGVDAYVNGGVVGATTTAVSLTGARGQCIGVKLSGTPTTGFSLGAIGTAVMFCTVTGGTTGISVGAFASCRVIGNYNTGPTTGLSVNASATNLQQFGNSDPTSRSVDFGSQRLKFAHTEDADTTIVGASFVPVVTGGAIHVNRYIDESSGVGGNITISNTATTGLLDGDITIVQIVNSSGTSISIGQVWGNQYYESDEETVMASVNITQNNSSVYWFQWHADTSRWVLLQSRLNFDSTS